MTATTARFAARFASAADYLAAGGGDAAALRSDPDAIVAEVKRSGLRGRGGAEPDLADLTGLVVGSWSFDLALPADAQTLDKLPPADRQALSAAVLAELPELRRAVHPAPGWRRR